MPRLDYVNQTLANVSIVYERFNLLPSAFTPTTSLTIDLHCACHNNSVHVTLHTRA